MTCAICHTRRPKRFCPGVRGDICTICCGTEREVTVDCPFDCEYLQDAHKHEKAPPLDLKQLPNRDIRVNEEFLARHDNLLVVLGRRILDAGLETHSAVDFDVREALEGLIKTYRTLESGVVYESVPANPLAARIFRSVRDGIEEFRRDEVKNAGMTRTRDADVLGILVFYQRLEYDRNNGRRRGRAFLESLWAFYSEEEGPPPGSRSSSLILP